MAFKTRKGYLTHYNIFYLPLSISKNKKLIDQIIRVNHAGEYGAKRIYEGQMAFTKDQEARKEIQEMYESELEHLDYFSNAIKERQVRPTALFPVWHVAGYALGAITSMMGNKAAMACTYAIEDVIEDHYQEQLDQLDDDEGLLKEKIAKFQAEEVSHKDIAKTYGIEEGGKYLAINKFVKLSSKLAIYLSKRI